MQGIENDAIAPSVWCDASKEGVDLVTREKIQFGSSELMAP